LSFPSRFSREESALRQTNGYPLPTVPKTDNQGRK
jgi:hypothetical protein